MSSRYFRSAEKYELPTKEFIGGKVNIARSLRKTNRGFSKSMNAINPMAQAVKDPTLNKAMRDIGKYTQKEILPAVVSTGIPIASTAVGALAGSFGGPIAGEMASGMTEGLLKEYIPQKYQSDNPYVGMLGDALSMGMSGEIDPYQSMMLSNQFSGQFGSDMTARPSYDSSRPQFIRGYDNREYPYADMMAQVIRGYIKPSEPDPNSLSDALYKAGKVGLGADSVVMVSPPFQQREGSMNGMLGGRIKKKGRLPEPSVRRQRQPKKIIDEEEIEVVVKKRLPHKKFSHAKNRALDQLLEAYAEREDKESKKAMKEMIEKQTRMLKALGY